MIWDIVIVVIILISTLIAFFRGFVREVLTIVGVVGGLAAAYYGGPLLSPVLRDLMGVEDGATGKFLDFIPYTLLADGLSYVVIFLCIVVVLSLTSHFIASAFSNSSLGMIDRTLGIVFGIARGAVLLALLYMPAHIFLDVDTKRKYFDGSYLIFYLELGSDTLAGYLPGIENDQEKLYDPDMTREKLEETNVLKPLEDAGNISESFETPTQPPDGNNNPNNGPGYDQGQREMLDQLFREQDPENQ